MDMRNREEISDSIKFVQIYTYNTENETRQKGNKKQTYFSPTSDQN